MRFPRRCWNAIFDPQVQQTSYIGRSHSKGHADGDHVHGNICQGWPQCQKLIQKNRNVTPRHGEREPRGCEYQFVSVLISVSFYADKNCLEIDVTTPSAELPEASQCNCWGQLRLYVGTHIHACMPLFMIMDPVLSISGTCTCISYHLNDQRSGFFIFKSGFYLLELWINLYSLYFRRLEDSRR